jgi:Ca2+-binding RTX toxin-like protein
VIHGRGGDDVIFAGRGIDSVLGGPGDDVIGGGRAADGLSGGPGADVVRGQGGRDEISGGVGRDRLLGGRGEDECLAGADGHEGNDTLNGGPGKAVFEVDDGDTVRRAEKEAPCSAVETPPP